MAKSNSNPSICVPAMLYLILAVIGLITMAMKSCGALCLLFKILFVIIWTWFLNFLCKSGYTTISWILVILPFIMFILMILIVIELMKINNVKENFSSPEDSFEKCKHDCNLDFDNCTKSLKQSINSTESSICIDANKKCLDNCHNIYPMPPMPPELSINTFSDNN
jgi:amino acid transporter